MKERLAGCFDEAVEASLSALDPDDLKEQLRKYLADAHAIEQQSIALLERASARDEGELDAAYEDHLAESRDQAESIAARLDALGGDTSSFKDAFMKTGAVNWATFFKAHPDAPGKLAAFAYAFEYLEIGGYEQLKRVARRAGDETTGSIVDRILDQERTADQRIEGMFDAAVTAALESVGVVPSR